MVPSIIFGCVIDIVSDDNIPWLITEGCTLTGFECHSHRRQLMMAMFIFAAVGLTSSFATFGASSLKRIAAARLLQDLRVKLFSAIAAQGCTFFDQSSTGRPRVAHRSLPRFDCLSTAYSLLPPSGSSSPCCRRAWQPIVF